MQARRRVGPVRVDRDDVRVLEPGQRLRLARAGPRDLQRHRPVGELPLLGEEDPGERPPAQLLDQVEAGDRLPGLGEGRSARGPGTCEVGRGGRADEAVDVEDPAEPVGELGEPLVVLGRDRGLAVLLAEAELLVDEGDERLVVEAG